MRYSATAFFLFCCYAFLPATAMEKYENPALNRVKFETPLNHRPLELVKDGKLQFAIVCDLAAEKNARIAGTDIPIKPACHSLHASSRYLQKYLERCFGEKPRILSPDSPELSSYPFKILLGKSIHTDKLGIDIMKMPPDGFKIMSYEGGIAIAGRDGSMIPGFYQWNDMGNYAANGTLCAVFDFLERFLGMRFYYPGLGVIAPKQNRLTITPVAYTDQPKYLTRSFGRPGGAFHAKGEKPRPLGLGKTSEWPWQDIPDDQGDFTAAYRMQSRPTRWMCSEGPNPFRVAGAFPDQLETCFYRDGNGRLRQSFTQYTANYFDLSNMEFSRLLAESFRKFYESKGKVNLLWDKIFCPNPEYMYFGPVDAHCVIDNERTAHLPKRKEKYAVMSEVNGQFYLDLAKRLKAMLPDKKIAFMAYSNFLAAPESVDHFPDNARFLVCTGTPVFIRDKASEKFWKDTYSSWNRKVTEKVAPYPYDPAYNMQGGISHAIRGSFEGEYLRRMASCISDYAIFPCVYFRWDYYYSHYLTARAYWNPGFNDKAALDEHWKLLYGTAAPCLKDFYDLVITRWNDHYIPNAKIAHGSIPGLDYEALYKKAYPRDVLDRMRALLGKARTRVKKGSDEERRLNFFVMPWTRIMNEAAAYGTLRTPPPYKMDYAEEEIKVDGHLEESAWKKARQLKFKAAYYGEEKKITAPDARIVWNGSGIYIGIFNPAPYKKTGKLWGDDNFEFFLSPGSAKNKLFQFVLSAGGEFEDYFQSFDPPRDLEASWKCKGLRKAVRSDEKGWYCELFIPFASLDGTPAPIPGDSWHANIVNNRNDSETASCAPTLGNNRNMNFYACFYFAGNCEQ